VVFFSRRPGGKDEIKTTKGGRRKRKRGAKAEGNGLDISVSRESLLYASVERKGTSIRKDGLKTRHGEKRRASLFLPDRAGGGDLLGARGGRRGGGDARTTPREDTGKDLRVGPTLCDIAQGDDN